MQRAVLINHVLGKARLRAAVKDRDDVLIVVVNKEKGPAPAGPPATISYEPRTTNH